MFRTVRYILAGMVTSTQGQVNRAVTLEMVTDYIHRNGWAPTYQEIMDATGIASKSTIFTHLTELEREGKLRLGHQGRSNGARMIALNRDPRMRK